jgi:hypothetical protein
MRPSPLLTRFLPAAVAGTLALALVPAAAASLNLRPDDLTAFSTPASVEPPGLPPPLASDDFSGCQNDLAGTVDSVGNVWQVDLGSFQCQGEWVRSRNRNAWAAAVVDVGVSGGISVSASLTSVSNQAGGSGSGVAVLSSGSSFVAGVYDRDRGVVELHSVNGATAAVLASAPAPSLGALTIAVSVDGGEIALRLDGATLISGVAIPAGMGGSTRHGITSDQDNQSRFVTFTVEQLP